ncbi:MAG: DUF61 family protein [Methanomassiliicoccaceae archaeon]|nr:DUF61 family protein [Methanomassiliicoccaceae archaeon]
MDIENIIRDMNRHMPVSRKTLLEHLESGDDTYETKDGLKCSLDRKDLEALAAKCTEIEKMRLRIPIFVSTDTSCETGAWKIDGRTEAAVVSKILNKRIYKEDFLRLYYPDLQDLKRMFPSLVVTLFLP